MYRLGMFYSQPVHVGHFRRKGTGARCGWYSTSRFGTTPVFGQRCVSLVACALRLVDMPRRGTFAGPLPCLRRKRLQCMPFASAKGQGQGFSSLALRNAPGVMAWRPAKRSNCATCMLVVTRFRLPPALGPLPGLLSQSPTPASAARRGMDAKVRWHVVGVGACAVVLPY